MGQDFRAEAVDSFLFDIAVAYLRRGETQNCCQQHTPDSCILPIQGAGIHVNTEGSAKAIEFLLAVLQRTSPDERLHLAAQWLLNVAYMTVGRHPQDVPAEYLIPPAAFESEASFPKFVDVAASAGVATFSLAGSAIADDFDNDGNLDLIVSTSDPGGQLRVFWNRTDGTFVDGTQAAGITGIYGGLNLVQADYDNDGHLDVLVLRGGWLTSGGRHPNSLLRNNGDRTFTDVTYVAGLAMKNYPTQTAAWADYDLDGDLDLYVGNETLQDLDAPCQLFRNNGDGLFVDVA